MTTQDKALALSDKHFIDWENHVFGYGYGTGEAPILRCLHFFFSSLEDGRRYDYEVLESGIGRSATWFLINALCHAKIIDYGTSPRFGWISNDPAVNALRDYVISKTPDELYDIVMNISDDYVQCTPSHCNCEIPCNNPLFL